MLRVTCSLPGVDQGDFNHVLLSLPPSYSLSELPECHIEVAYNDECLEQLTCISLTPSVGIVSVQLVATLFLCLAYNPLTHPSLTKPLLIRRLLDACSKEHYCDPQNLLLLR